MGAIRAHTSSVGSLVLSHAGLSLGSGGEKGRVGLPGCVSRGRELERALICVRLVLVKSRQLFASLAI